MVVPVVPAVSPVSGLDSLVESHDLVFCLVFTAEGMIDIQPVVVLVLVLDVSNAKVSSGNHLVGLVLLESKGVRPLFLIERVAAHIQRISAFLASFEEVLYRKRVLPSFSALAGGIPLIHCPFTVGESAVEAVSDSAALYSSVGVEPDVASTRNANKEQEVLHQLITNRILKI